jgi:diacylglycerol kinase
MKGQQKFSMRKRIKSFAYAFNGLRILFREERNSRIYLMAALCALVAGCFLKITSTVWIVVIFAIRLCFSPKYKGKTNNLIIALSPVLQQ